MQFIWVDVSFGFRIFLANDFLLKPQHKRLLHPNINLNRIDKSRIDTEKRQN